MQYSKVKKRSKFSRGIRGHALREIVRRLDLGNFRYDIAMHEFGHSIAANGVCPIKSRVRAVVLILWGQGWDKPFGRPY